MDFGSAVLSALFVMIVVFVVLVVLLFCVKAFSVLIRGIEKRSAASDAKVENGGN